MSSDYTYIEANINNSFEKNNINSRWINKINDGIVIDENSKLVVQSAYVNQVGAGSEVIQFDKEKIGTNSYFKYKPASGPYGILPSGTVQYDGKYELITEDVYDNKVKIQFTYYKTADCQNSFPLPYPGFSYSAEKYEPYLCSKGNEKDDEIQLGITSSTYKSNFNYNFPFDNKRYTIMVQDPNSRYTGDQRGDQNPGYPVTRVRNVTRFEYYPYVEEVEIEIPEGFSTPSAIAQIITDKLNKMSQPKIQKMEVYQEINDGQYPGAVAPLSYRTMVPIEINGSFYAESSVFKLIDCASIRNFYQDSYTSFYNVQYNGSQKINEPGTGLNTWFLNSDSEVQAYQDAFKYIGVYNPDVFMAGRNINRNVEYTHTQQEIYKIMEKVEIGTTTGLVDFEIKTNILYNEANLKQFSILFNYQVEDSELYENKPAKEIMATPQTYVFLHMMPNDEFHVGWELHRFGSNESMYPMPGFGQPPPEYNEFMTNPVFIKYDPSKKNIYGENNAYGVFEKYLSGDIEYAKFKITLKINSTTNSEGNVIYSNNFFNFPLTNSTTTLPLRFRQIGWDRSFSALGNQSILLFSGVTTKSQLSTKIDGITGAGTGEAIFQNQFKTEDLTIYDYGTAQNKIYLGADSILFNFDDIGSRFTFEGLHTPRREFNTALSGYDTSILRNVTNFYYRGQKGGSETDDAYFAAHDVDFPTTINPNQGNAIYQLNPSPISQQTIEVSNTIDTPSDRDVNVLGLMKTNTIFDAACGIFIENFGVDSNSYNNSLWDKLGFSKDQVYSYMVKNLFDIERIILNRQYRHLDSGVNILNNIIYPFTSNANVAANDIMKWRTNPFGISYFNTLSLPNNMMVMEKDGTNVNYRDVAPYQVTQDQLSSKMYAMDLPKKTNIPFYQIRSDILPAIQYFGGNRDSSSNLPVVAIVNKAFPGADYYSVSGDDSMEFIFKKRVVLNSIITEIYDNNGRPAKLDGFSSIIYRIEKLYTPPKILPFQTQAEYEESIEAKKKSNK